MYRRKNESTYGSASSSGLNVPWSVHAQFSIRRDDDNSSPIEVRNRAAVINPDTESSGVRMTYSFTPSQVSINSNVSNLSTTPPGTYSFQRGNLLFTSTPPPRLHLPVRSHTIPRTTYSQSGQQFEKPSINRTHCLDSSSNRYNNKQLPSQQISDKRCKSTYNIVLSTANPNGNLETRQSQKPQSHLPYPRPWSTYYQQHQAVHQQCNRPYYHLNAESGICKSCSEAVVDSGPFRTHFCTKLSDKILTDTGFSQLAAGTISKDAASQTTDIEAQHSPIVTRRKFRRKVPGTFIGSPGKEELKNNNFDRLSKMPASSNNPMPLVEQPISDSPTSTNTVNTRDDNSEKRKRTVHIDVYCTGTDDDINDEDDNRKNLCSISADSNIRQQKTKIFENSDVCVIHTEAKGNLLPRGFQDENAFLNRVIEKRNEISKHVPERIPSIDSSKDYESDDVFSSLYPSQFSSYSRLRDLESSLASSTSIAIDEYDSTSATSWKDTISDLDSIVNSKSSITPCDSFDYADSVDQERIRRLEHMIRKTAGKTPPAKTMLWRPHHPERRYLMQRKMMNEYIEKHPPVRWSSESSETSTKSDENSLDEMGWSFVSSEENVSIVTGKLTLPQFNTPNDEKPNAKQITLNPRTDQEPHPTIELSREIKNSLFRDRIGPFGSMSPSSTPSKFQSRVTSPFTTPQGEKTDHIMKASIFGRVINTVKKPGHHVGPAKNPACSCEHCRRHFEEITTRGRSRSLDPINRRNRSRAPSLTH